MREALFMHKAQGVQHLKGYIMNIMLRQSLAWTPRGIIEEMLQVSEFMIFHRDMNQSLADKPPIRLDEQLRILPYISLRRTFYFCSSMRACSIPSPEKT
jgi:hypothetical protein